MAFYFRRVPARNPSVEHTASESESDAESMGETYRQPTQTHKHPTETHRQPEETYRQPTQKHKHPTETHRQPEETYSRPAETQRHESAESAQSPVEERRPNFSKPDPKRLVSLLKCLLIPQCVLYLVCTT